MTKMKPIFAAGLAAALSCVLVMMLGFAWLKSGSVSILSAMVDSVMDIVISGSNVLVIRYAFKPADLDHRFGHGKMEGIAALTQAAFICGSAVFVCLESINRFSHPEPIKQHGIAIAVLTVVTLLTLVLTNIQERVAKASGSLAVEADHAHFVGDIAVNIGVITTVAIDWWFQMNWLDPLVAVMVVGWLVWAAFGIGRKAVDMLLDKEIGDPIRTDVKRIIRETPNVIDFHDLRLTRSGPRFLIAVDVEVPRDMSIVDAHTVARDIEDRLLMAYRDAQIMIHLDPAGDVNDSRHPQNLFT